MTTEINGQILGRDVSFTLAESWLMYWLVIMRFGVGWWLLHAGLDKIMAWPFDASWFVSGTAAGTSIGPFVTLFSDGILLSIVNIAIPLGQLAIGLGIILGALTRMAAFFGATLMMFFFFINGETGGWAHGIVTGEFLGIIIFGMIATLGAGKVLSVDAYLRETQFVKNHPRLRYIIG